MSLKKNIRNIFIALLSISGASWLYRWYARRGGPLVRVIVFHDVTNAEWFQRTISHIDTQYHVVSPQDFFDSRFDSKKINVLITFDDGYASWTDICLPILTEKNLKALFFVNSGLIDTYDDMSARDAYVRTNLLISPRNTLSWEGVQKLFAEGHMIGGHSVTHARLSAVSADVVKNEIVGDKKRIEENLECSLTTFAYPFGQRTDFTASTKTVVAHAGYKTAFSTEAGFMSREYDVFSIPRLCLEENLSFRQIDSWTLGGYDIYTKLKQICVQ